MQRFDQRQGFLVSALVHLVVLMSLASHPDQGRAKGIALPREPALPPSRRVFIPPAETLRRLLPATPPRSARSAPTPRAQPTPPPAEKLKDRISVGAPSDERAKGPLILRREDDLTAVPKGRPHVAPATPAPPPVPDQRPPAVTAKAGDLSGVPRAPGLRLAPGSGEMLRGEEGARKGAAPRRPLSDGSIREYVDRRLLETGPRGLPSGTGKQMGPLFFDPEGADFTAWINHFKNEAYNNWIIPSPAQLGFRGHVDIEFTVERDGTISGLKVIKSAGQPALDRAAENALLGSRLLPLPPDFRPPRVTMQVGFYYNEGPSAS